MEPARTILRGGAGFPPRLMAVDPAPARLRVRGQLGAPGLPRVAIVGSRDCDAYGAALAVSLASGLARAGVSIVSGGARGIDGAAHEAALDAGGHTVAVLGTGVDVAYPREHAGLFERIVARGGALLSEHDDGEQPRRGHFPQRNRLVSGLADAVVVVQAAEGSGALLTARWARRQGVPLLAVPGEVGNPRSVGPIALLREGARVAATAADVLAAIGLPAQPELPLGGGDAPALDGNLAAVWGALTRAPRHADEVARAAGLAPGPALAALLALELDGLAEQQPGQRFLRRAPTP